MESFTINVPVIITTEDIDNIMETANESGYSWFEGMTKGANGWKVVHEDVEADEPETFGTRLIPYSQLLAAIQDYYTNRRASSAPWLRFDDELAHMIDVNVADSIVQLAVYDEIVFG